LKDPENNTGSGDIRVAPSEHSISDASTSRAAVGPLHSFNPSPCTVPGSSGVDVASSEVSSVLRNDPSRSVAPNLDGIADVHHFYHRRKKVWQN